MTARIAHAYRGGHNGRPGWRLVFAYDQDLVEQLKAKVPPSERSYNDESHEWWIAEEQAEQLLAIAPSFEAFYAARPLF